MKTLIASALLATAAFTGTAQAMTSPQLDPGVRFILPGADFSGLTDRQIHQINALIHSGDNRNETRQVIRALVN